MHYARNNIDLNLDNVEHIVDNDKQDNNYLEVQHDDEIDDDDGGDDDDYPVHKCHHHPDRCIQAYNPF